MNEDVDQGLTDTNLLPFGFIGEIAHFLFIKRDLKNIFNYRKKRINELLKG